MSNPMDQDRFWLERPILLVGSGGMLGRAWRQWLQSRDADVRAVDLPQFSLTDVESIKRHVTDGTGVVINCAAYTDVDGAESDEAAALAVNGEGVGQLADRCAVVGATLVHYSTDYVFSGQASEPYATDAPRQPLGAYGRTKARGEELIESSGADFLLIRTSWLYAPWAKNFVRTIARVAGEREMLRVVNDQRGRPTSAEHLAHTTAALLDHGTRGTFHVTDGGQCTWYEFAAKIVELRGARCRVEPCTTDEFPRPAPRPAYSVLDLAPTEAIVGPMPHWSENLANVIERLES
jgi:dTDP-4-dehydrorhamnose reductase